MDPRVRALVIERLSANPETLAAMRAFAARHYGDDAKPTDPSPADLVERFERLLRPHRPLPGLPRPAPGADPIVNAVREGYWRMLDLLRGAEADGSLGRLARSMQEAPAPATPDPNTVTATAAKRRGPRMTAGERMKVRLATNPESVWWSAATWAKHLGCSPGTVKEDEMWAKIMAARALEKAEEVTRRRSGSSGRRVIRKRPSGG
jgi:hypothetical protein